MFAVFIVRGGRPQAILGPFDDIDVAREAGETEVARQPAVGMAPATFMVVRVESTG